MVAILHDLNLTALFADRIGLLKGGELAAACGTVGDVLTDERSNRSSDVGCG